MRKICFIACFLLAVASIASAQAKLQEGLTLKYLVQLPADKSAKPPVIILLHGYGSNEQDLFELKNIFPKNYLVLSARAPYPVGQEGFQWFDLRKGDAISEINNSRELIIKFVAEATAKYNADEKQVYLAGFSQGAMMSYEVGLTKPGMITGIGVLSGRMFPSLKKKTKFTAELKRLKIFIAHGTSDDRVSFADGKAAYDFLKSINLKPDFHTYSGMGHSINNNVLNDLVKWLQMK